MPQDTPQVTFQLTEHQGRIEVRATAPGGEGRAEADLPPAVEPTLGLLSAAQVRAQGGALYRCLTAGELQGLVESALQAAGHGERPVRFELRFDHDQVALARYPWETLCDDLERPLVRDGLVDLTRYVTYPQPPPPWRAVTGGAPMLRLIAQPPDQPPLGVADLTMAQMVTLQHATFDAVQDRLLIERALSWGIHFDGHGALLGQCRACETLNPPDAPRCLGCQAVLTETQWVGALAFEGPEGTDWVTTDEMGAILYNAQVQFAMLLACETARVGGRSLFGGLAPGLLLAGVPAVLGMQYPVDDHFAGRFANRFYQVLRQTDDLLAALRAARRASVRDAWYSPALYVRRRPSAEQAAAQPAYQVRHIDTATPAQAQPNVPFLTRLWIRRPDTPPLSEHALRAHLGIAPTVDVDTETDEAEVRFEPVKGRRLRRGQVEVRLACPLGEVTPPAIPLFVDEDLDAPPAIFTVRATAPGSIPLLFGVYQEGAQIASLVHHVQVVDRRLEAQPLRVASHALGVEGGAAAWTGPETIGGPGAESAIRRRCPSCGMLAPWAARTCPTCGALLERVTPNHVPLETVWDDGEGDAGDESSGCTSNLLRLFLSIASLALLAALLIGSL